MTLNNPLARTLIGSAAVGALLHTPRAFPGQMSFSAQPVFAPEGEGAGAGGGEAGAGDEGAGKGGEGDGEGDLGLDDTALGKASEGKGAGKEGEGKAAEGEGGDDKTKAGEGEAKAEDDAGPEKFEIKPPEGFAALDDAALEAATPLLKQLGVKSSEQAQEVINTFAKDVLKPMLDRVGQGVQQAQVQQIAEIRKGWHDALVADTELGGAKHEEAMTVAAKARDLFGGPALTKLLNETGIGNHPDLVRAFYRVGLQVQEGSFHRSDGSEQRQKDDGELFYGDAYKQAS